jgi:hypothetical protein
MWRTFSHFKQAIILCILIKNIFVQDFKVININSWNANKHIDKKNSYSLCINVIATCFMVFILFYKFTLKFHNWNVWTIYMNTNHIQTNFTKICDDKRGKRKALIDKLKTKGLGWCLKSFKIICVLVLHRSTNHALRT